jgi:hypothetical protein
MNTLKVWEQQKIEKELLKRAYERAKSTACNFDSSLKDCSNYFRSLANRVNDMYGENNKNHNKYIAELKSEKERRAVENYWVISNSNGETLNEKLMKSVYVLINDIEIIWETSLIEPQIRNKEEDTKFILKGYFQYLSEISKWEGK